MTKLIRKAVIIVIILISLSAYLMQSHKENDINTGSDVVRYVALMNANNSLKHNNIKIVSMMNENISLNYNKIEFYIENKTVKPDMTIVTRRQYNTTKIDRGTLERRFPKALILGFDKAGTDALRDMLMMNPYIVGPQREINYFKSRLEYTRGVEWYRNQMPLSYKDQITIEKSIYIRYPDAYKKIRDFDPKMKLLIIVREPVVRLISDYLDHKRKMPTVTPSTFEKWVCYGCKHFSQFVERSIYSKKYLPQYLELFPRNQIFIVDGDKLIKDPYPVIKEAEQFLGVPDSITSEHFYFSETKGFWCMKSDVENANGCMASWKGREPPQINPDLVIQLRKYYHPYNLEFNRMTGVDFGWPEF